MTRADEETGAFAALDSADNALDSADSDHGAPRAAFFDRNRSLAERGVTAIRFDRAVDDRAALEQVLAELDQSQNIRSRLLTSLAKAHIRHGNIDEAVEIALESLDVAVWV